MVVKFLWIKFILVSAIILLKLPGSGSIIPLHSFHWWTLFFFLPLWQEVHQICPSFKLPTLIFLYTLLCFCFVFIYFAVILIIYFQPLALGLSDFFFIFLDIAHEYLSLRLSFYCVHFVLEISLLSPLCYFYDIGAVLVWFHVYFETYFRALNYLRNGLFSFQCWEIWVYRSQRTIHPVRFWICTGSFYGPGRSLSL